MHPPAATSRLVLIRHGESAWNADNRFAGWVDVDLTARGIEEAARAGALLRSHGIDFDECHTSVLKRANRTLWHVLDALDRTWLPVRATWRLNERHYGALQGLDKAAAAGRFGAAQVKEWRRGYDARPPALGAEAAALERADPRYAGIPAAEFPLAESLHDTITRMLPYWRDTLAPQLAAGRSVMVVAHGNSIRALRAHVEALSPSELPLDEIPHGTPLLYAWDGRGRIARHAYLGSAPQA